MAGEDATVGYRLQFAVAQVTAILHEVFEPGVGILDDRFQRRLGLGAGRLKAARRRLKRARFHRLDLDADLVEQVGKIRILEQHADRADQRGLLCHDVVAGQRRDVGAGGGEAIDDDDDRFLVPQPRQRVVKLLGAGGGAAGAVDMDDDGARQRRAGEPVERLHPIAIAADQTFDGDAGDIRAHAGEARAIAAQSRHARDGEHDHADGDDAPERKLPTHAAAVDDQVGIKRHGRAPYWSFRIATDLGFTQRSALYRPSRQQPTWMAASPESIFTDGGYGFRAPRFARTRNDGLFVGVVVALLVLLALALERGAEDVAQRCAGIRGAVLRDGLLLLGNFQRLDRDLHFVGAPIELDDAGVDLLADGKAVRTLLGTVTRQLRTLDEGGVLGADDLHVDAAFLHVDHLTGDDGTLLELAGSAGIGRGSRATASAAQLLDAERDALLLDVDVEHLRLDLVALLVLLNDLFARPFPVEIGQVHHAVDVTVEAEEQAEFGLVLDLALDLGAGRIFLQEHLPGIAHGLLEAKRNAALDRIDLEHLHLDLLRRRNDLAGMHVLLGPRHFRDVDQTFDAGLELDEGAVVGDVGDAALEARSDRIFGLDALPGSSSSCFMPSE